MSKRSREDYANRAAQEASEAGRVLQAQKTVEPSPEPETVIEPSSGASTVVRPTPTPQISEREQVLAELRVKRGEVDPATLPDTPVVKEAAATPTPAVTPNPDHVEAAPEPVMVKVKINGKEYDVSQTDIDEAGGLNAYRTDRAAQERLDEAKQIAAQTRQSQAELAKFMQALQPAPAPKPTNEQRMQKLAQARFGTDEEYAAALTDVISSATSPAINPNDIVTQATASMNFDQARKQFASEFADVISNPLLDKLARQLEFEGIGQYVQNGQPQWQHLAGVDFSTFYRNIGNQVRSVSGRPLQPQPNAAAPVTDTSSPVSDKEARKSSIVNLPTAASRAALPAEEKPETREQSLDRMRKSRGLPTG